MTEEQKKQSLVQNISDDFKYRTEHRTQSGRACVDTGDTTARDLRGLTIEQVYRYTYRALHVCDITTIGRGAKRVTIEPGVLEARYGKLNLGLQRMALGNIIRGAKSTVGQ